MNHLERLDISQGGDLSDVYRDHLATLRDPSGRVFYVAAKGGLTEDPAAAFVYSNRTAAWAASRAVIGYGPAFWESERQSQARALKAYRGWTAPDPTPVA